MTYIPIHGYLITGLVLLIVFAFIGGQDWTAFFAYAVSGALLLHLFRRRY